MDSKQQILQQENDQLHQLIDRVDTALNGWMAAANAWEVDKTEANATALQTALEAYQNATGKLAQQISSLRRLGYNISIEWGE